MMVIKENTTIDILIGFALIIIGLWMIFSFIKKQKIDSYYDVKGLGIGIACLIGGLFLFFKSIL